MFHYIKVTFNLSMWNVLIKLQLHDSNIRCLLIIVLKQFPEFSPKLLLLKSRSRNFVWTCYYKTNTKSQINYITKNNEFHTFFNLFQYFGLLTSICLVSISASVSVKLFSTRKQHNLERLFTVKGWICFEI
jgi:hypothetical protein